MWGGEEGRKKRGKERGVYRERGEEGEREGKKRENEGEWEKEGGRDR